MPSTVVVTAKRGPHNNRNQVFSQSEQRKPFSEMYEQVGHSTKEYQIKPGNLLILHIPQDNGEQPLVRVDYVNHTIVNAAQKIAKRPDHTSDGHGSSGAVHSHPGCCKLPSTHAHQAAARPHAENGTHGEVSVDDG